MQGSQILPLRGGAFAAVLAVSLLTFAGSAQAQNAAPALPQTASGKSVIAPELMPGAMTIPGLTCCQNAGEPVRMSFRDTIHESLWGDASAEGRWRPLTLGSFFTEGWDEPWAGGPAGQSGLTPRHGWLGSFEGLFYRLWLVNGTYQHNLNQPYGGDGYGTNFITFLPFSRRFELYVNVPFINTNGTEDPTRGYRTDFGDIQLAGSFLLSESECFTQLFTLGVVLPTGQTETRGNLAAVNPRYSFWSNPFEAWVVRGGTGVNIPVRDSTLKTTYNADLAIGRYFRPHDVPFGDLVFYVNCNLSMPLEDGGPSQVGIGPGTRFQIGGNWYFLSYWEIHTGNVKPFDHQFQMAIVRAW